MIEGGKEKYNCLLTLIKHESKQLYELICDLCLDYVFRSQKYKTTFLMPSTALVSHIAKLVDNDKDAEAVEIIRSLLLKGHFEPKDFVKGAKISTLQISDDKNKNFNLSEPEKVGKELVQYGKTVITTKKNLHAANVLQYKGMAPSTTEGGATGGFSLVGSIDGGSDKNLEHFKALTKKMIDKNHETTVENFFHGVAGLLTILEEDQSRFNRAKFYLASNPILSWFFLTLPGSGLGLVKDSELEKFTWNGSTDLDLIKKAAEAGDYKLDGQTMRMIKECRSRLISGDRSNLINMIESIYSKNLSDLEKDGCVDSVLAKHPHLKLLMDELRFVHEGSINSHESVTDAIDALKCIHWANPAKHLSICSKEVQDALKSTEAFASGPGLFVRSIYLLYVPLTEAIESQLGGIQGGAINGGNPSDVRNVIFTGGAARSKLRASAKDKKLDSLVRSLSKKQREELKKML